MSSGRRYGEPASSCSSASGRRYFVSMYGPNRSRRHLEAIGDNETFGFAGFFNAAIRYQALGNHHETDRFPVILKARNRCVSFPEPIRGGRSFRGIGPGAKLSYEAHASHDLKENVDYALCHGGISSDGFTALPMIGKIIFSSWYSKSRRSAQAQFSRPRGHHPDHGQALHGRKSKRCLPPSNAAIIRRALQEKFGDRNLEPVPRAAGVFAPTGAG